MEISKGDLIWMYNINWGFVLYEVIKVDQPCTICGGGDGVVVEVIADNNVGLDFESGYVLPNRKQGVEVKDCKAKLIIEIQTNNDVRKVPEGSAEYLKLRAAIESQ